MKEALVTSVKSSLEVCFCWALHGLRSKFLFIYCFLQREIYQLGDWCAKSCKSSAA